MSRFIDEANRSQATLLPKTIDEYVSEENPVRVIDAFVCALDVASLGFERAEPKTTGRPGYDPQHDASVIGIPFSNENRGASPQGFPAVPVYGYSETSPRRDGMPPELERIEPR